MITSAKQVVQCPTCKQELPRSSNFRLFGRSEANIYACKKCDKIVLSWRVFIKSHHKTANNPIVLPLNERVHELLIVEAREINEDGSSRFNEERLLVLTDEQFMQYRRRFRKRGASEIAIAIGAYCEQVGLSPTPN